MNGEQITDAIARQAWAMPVEDALQKAVSGAFKAGGKTGKNVEDALHGTWLGHPLHPVLTDVPLGAWTVAAALDLIEAGTGRTNLARGADAAIAIGLIGAAGAAVTGLTDWHDTDNGSDDTARRIGLAHGLLNLTATALYTTSWILRRRRQRGAARAFGLFGYTVVVAAAYLGGTLVYGKKIGTDHTDREALPQEFIPVLAADKLLENTPTRVDAKGSPVVLVRQGEHIYALAETCSHLGGPLSEGTVEGASIRCPWHGSRFALEDGRVLDSPATFPQPCLEARVRDGQIEVGIRKSAGTGKSAAIKG